MQLPEPICSLGYPEPQVREIFKGDEKLWILFCQYMVGQTIGVCEELLYDHEADSYVTNPCGAHGIVYYAVDVSRFLDGLPPLD